VEAEGGYLGGERVCPIQVPVGEEGRLEKEVKVG
jgi:hypothetical protein